MKRKSRRALPSLTRGIALVVLLLWLFCMYAITAVTAESLSVEYWGMGQDFMERAWTLAHFSDSLDGDKLHPRGYTEYVLWQALLCGTQENNYGMLSALDHRQVLRSEAITAECAVAVFDAEGSAAAYPSNFFTVAYYDAEADVGDEKLIDGYAVCVLDRQMDSDMAKQRLEQSFLGSLRYDVLCYRITGVLEGGYLTVQKVEYLLDPNSVEDGASEWLGGEMSYGNAVPADAETVTLYTDDIDAQTYTEGRAFQYGGDAYRENWTKTDSGEGWRGSDETVTANNLREFILDAGPDLDKGISAQLSLWDFVYAQATSYSDRSGWDGTDENLPECEYRLVVALLASPWRSAISALRNVYIVSFLIVLVGMIALRTVLKRDVIAPVSAVNDGIEDGFRNLYLPNDSSPKLAEMSLLFSNYHEIKAQRSNDRDAIKRLETSLEYAKTAEENRRKMTSNIAHELKTPLAIIHSYAEGLSERIAEDKREQYLAVIQSETERMNEMVMEMLDLSRLEAGKVKLSREDFSLSKLTASVFQRLERAIEAKELSLTMELDDDCIIHADMARIEQVITNFAVNAVKYTPSHGSILVRSTKAHRSVALSVENESEPLSAAALSKIWETFYSAEESRTASGTGLGLAIAKSIIDLHGGKCAVRNTKTGVEFRFALDA